MKLNDHTLNKIILGCLMRNSELLINEDFPLDTEDFVDELPKMIYLTMLHMKLDRGLNGTFEPIKIDYEINGDIQKIIYNRNNGIEFLKQCWDRADEANFEQNYNMLKKLSILRALQNRNYDISYYFKENPINLKEEMILKERLEDATVEEILNNVESQFVKLRSKYLRGVKGDGSISEGLDAMLLSFNEAPDVGIEIEGKIFSPACRGARLGKFYLRSGSSGTGKSRQSIFDSCKVCFPTKWSHMDGCFVTETYVKGDKEEPRPAVKVLMITTEMDKEEVQRVIIAYLSGVEEFKIVTNRTTKSEKERVEYARRLMHEQEGVYFIEEISDPDLNNVSGVIKRYHSLYNVEYVWFDYIFSSPSLMQQYSSQKVREDQALAMMANQLKVLAKDLHIFVASSSQLNGDGMNTPGFKDEKTLRGAKSLADKTDIACITQAINIEEWKKFEPSYNKYLSSLFGGANKVLDELISTFGINSPKIKPTHVLDIYKMRAGQYKNVRIWMYLNLGTGERYDLCMTNASNTIIDTSTMELFYTFEKKLLSNWRDAI